MPSDGWWSRVREARLVQVLAVYLGASWLILQVTDVLRDSLELPRWVSPVAVILLLIGLVIILATAWMQAHPVAVRREVPGSAPGSWQVGLADLKESIASGRVPHLTWARALLGGAFAFALLFGFAGLYVVIQDRGRGLTPEPLAAGEAAPGIAVLPFNVNSPELEVWREGMVDLLATNLDGTGGLRTIDSRTVLARWRESVKGSADPDLPLLLQVAGRTTARYAVVGSAVAAGLQVRLAADVYDLRSGADLGQAKAEGAADSVLALVDRLSVEVVRILLADAGEETPLVHHIAALTTSSLTALTAYLEGEALFRRSEFPAAIEAYERAAAADSSFALAWARLASAAGWIEGVGSEAVERYDDMAYRHLRRLPAREAVVLRASRDVSRGSVASYPELLQIVQRYPDDPEAWAELSEFHIHQPDVLLSDRETTWGALTRAVELDPGFAPYYIHVLERGLDWVDSATVAALLEAAARAGSDAERLSGHRLGFALSFGDSARAAEARIALDTAPVGTLRALQFSLTAPRNLEHRAIVLRSLRRRDPTAGGFLAWQFARTLGHLGRASEAVAALRDPLLDRRSRAAAAYELHYIGLPVPEEVLEASLRPGTSGLDSVHVLAVGAFAAERGRWDEHRRSVVFARDRASAALAEADTLTARGWEGVAEALEGVGVWRRGRPREALPLLSSALPKVAPYEFLRGAALVRTWLADVLAESGDTDGAIRHRDLYRQTPDDLLRLGELYERAGRGLEARQAYEGFLTAWRGADPGLPHPERARDGLERVATP